MGRGLGLADRERQVESEMPIFIASWTQISFSLSWGRTKIFELWTRALYFSGSLKLVQMDQRRDS